MEKLFGLFAFSVDGKSNPICFVEASTDEEAATKLAGQCVEPTMSRAQMTVYGVRLPALGEGWREFKFGNRQISSVVAMNWLAKAIGQPPAEELNSVQMLARNSPHLILTEVPFLKR